ncbi:MAG TPA: hypothetical protein VMZ04_08510, partial [Anaerolineae bacterium]|nr:hypothetical protein [Anaerolineae bacterium]
VVTGKVYYVWSIAVDKKNVRWFGTFNRGVTSFDGTMWKIYNKDNGLEFLFINSIAVGPDNVKWCGTDEGVASFDDMVWKHYTTKDGLAHNKVRAVAVDKNNVRWFGTFKHGVTSYK